MDTELAKFRHVQMHMSPKAWAHHTHVWCLCGKFRHVQRHLSPQTWAHHTHVRCLCGKSRHVQMHMSPQAWAHHTFVWCLCGNRSGQLHKQKHVIHRCGLLLKRYWNMMYAHSQNAAPHTRLRLHCVGSDCSSRHTYHKADADTHTNNTHTHTHTHKQYTHSHTHNYLKQQSGQSQASCPAWHWPAGANNDKPLGLKHIEASRPAWHWRAGAELCNTFWSFLLWGGGKHNTTKTPMRQQLDSRQRNRRLAHI